MPQQAFYIIQKSPIIQNIYACTLLFYLLVKKIVSFFLLFRFI